MKIERYIRLYKNLEYDEISKNINFDSDEMICELLILVLIENKQHQMLIDIILDIENGTNFINKI